MNIAKESSATRCKYIDRFVCKQNLFMNQALILILCCYKSLNSVHLKSQVMCEFKRKTREVYHSFATLSLNGTVYIFNSSNILYN